MKQETFTKKYLISILIFIFVFSFSWSYSLAQTEEKGTGESYKNFWDKLFDFWGKIHQEIKENWKGKILPKIANWLKQEKNLIKEELNKEIEEMKLDIISIILKPIKNLFK